MFDDLRESVNDAEDFEKLDDDLSDFGNFEPSFEEEQPKKAATTPRPRRLPKKPGTGKILGLTAGQFFLLSVVFFFLVTVFSVLFLVVTGTVVL